MSLRDQLLAAIDAGDHGAVRRGPWASVWESLATVNLPAQSCTLQELRHYALHLGYEDPDDILDAIEACAGKWRPSAGVLKGWLNARRGDGARVDVGRGRDRSSTPEALEAVAAALRSGERPCTCGSPTSRQWRRDAAWVLRCPEGHLEVGQCFQAEDAGLVEAVS